MGSSSNHRSGTYPRTTSQKSWISQQIESWCRSLMDPHAFYEGSDSKPMANNKSHLYPPTTTYRDHRSFTTCHYSGTQTCRSSWTHTILTLDYPQTTLHRLHLLPQTTRQKLLFQCMAFKWKKNLDLSHGSSWIHMIFYVGSAPNQILPLCSAPGYCHETHHYVLYDSCVSVVHVRVT